MIRAGSTRLRTLCSCPGNRRWEFPCAPWWPQQGSERRLNAAALRPQYRPPPRPEQMNQGRRPPKWQVVQVIGPRCSIDFHSVASQLRDRYTKITASNSVDIRPAALTAAFWGARRREPHESFGPFADPLEYVGAGDFGERLGQLEITKGAISARMNDPFRNALVVEVEDFIAEMLVFQQRRPPRTVPQGILIVGNRCALARGEDRAIVLRHLVGLTALALRLAIAFHRSRSLGRVRWLDASVALSGCRLL
jgi:hypothetical protein